MNNLYNVDLTKLSEMPKRASRRHLTISNYEYYNHSWFNTEDHKKASAIMRNSVGKNIEQIKTKIRKLIPPQENLEEYLSWHYHFLTLDGKVLERDGDITSPPEPSFSYHNNDLYVRPDGYIFQINKHRKHGQSTKGLSLQHEAKLLSRKKAKLKKLDRDYQAQISVYLINLPADLKYKRLNGLSGPSYYQCLMNLYMGTSTENYSFDQYNFFAKGIEQQYFEETGIKFKNGKRI